MSSLQEVCAEDGKGLQAVHHAAEQGLVRLVTALLEGGAAAEARDSRLRLTPLMIGQLAAALVM